MSISPVSKHFFCNLARLLSISCYPFYSSHVLPLHHPTHPLPTFLLVISSTHPLQHFPPITLDICLPYPCDFTFPPSLFYSCTYSPSSYAPSLHQSLPPSLPLSLPLSPLSLLSPSYRLSSLPLYLPRSLPLSLPRPNSYTISRGVQAYPL